MGTSANLLTRISADATPFTRAMGEVNTALDKAFQRAAASSRGFAQLGERLSSVGSTLTLGVTAPLLAFGAATIKAAADLDSLKRGLTAVAGSSAAAERQFKDLREVAKLPGLGLTDAVRGSINLQALGFSAQKSQQILQTFGNALATVGRGKEDLGETIRQLGQLGARGQVTADNLRPLIERIPQLATIIKTQFGPEALGDPAKTFQKLGIDSAKFIDVIIGELGKLPPVTGGAKNAIENLKDAIEISAGRIGEKFLPAVERILPRLEELASSAGDAADAFTSLPAPIQNVTIALTGLAIASGPIAAVTGRLIAAATAVKAFGATLTGLGVTAGGAGLAAGFLGIGAAVAGVLTPLLSTQTALENQEKAAAKTKATLDGLTKTYREKLVAQGQLTTETRSGYDSLLDYARGLTSTKAAAESVKPPVDAAAAAVEQFKNVTVSSYAEDFKTAVLKERLSLLTSEYSKRLTDGVAALVKYKTATQAANAALTELRITEEAPQIGRPITDVRKLPTPNVPGLPSGAVLDGSDAAKSSQRNLDLIRRTAQGATAAWGNTRQQISRQVSTITTDFSRAIADIVTGASSVGEAFSRLGKSIAQSLIRTVVETGVNVAIKALGNLLSSLGGVGKAIGGIFGGGASAAGGIGGAVGGAGGVGGSFGSAIAAANPVTAVVSAVSGVATAISSIFGNFQMAAMNKTLDLIEKEVRFTQIHALYILEKLNQYLPALESIHQRLIEFRQLGIKIEGGGAGTTVNITVQGSLVGGPNVAAELSAMVVRNLKLQGV